MNDLNIFRVNDLFALLNKNLENEKEFLKECFGRSEHLKQIIKEYIEGVEINKYSFLNLNNFPSVQGEFKHKNNFLKELEEQKVLYKKIGSYFENIESIINLLIVSKNKEQKYIEELKEFVIESIED